MLNIMYQNKLFLYTKQVARSLNTVGSNSEGVSWYSKCSKITNIFLCLFSNKMLIIRVGIHIMLVRKANREYPGKTASSDLGAFCLGLYGRQFVFEILEHLP